MDKLNINNNGGHPFTMDDIDFLQSALSEGIKGAMSPWFHSDVVILQGIVGTVGVTHTTYTNGYILHNNEILPVIGGVFLNGSYVIIDVAVTYNPIGNKLYENGTTVNCYEKRIGVMKISTGSVTEIDLADTITFRQSVLSKGFVMQDEPAWQAMTLINGWVNVDPSEPAQYRFNKIGEIEVRGIVSIASLSSGNATFFVLPTVFLPLKGVTFMLFGDDGVGQQSVACSIQTNGEMVCGNNNLGTNKLMYLNPIRFSKT